MAGMFKGYDIRMRGEELAAKNIDHVSEAVIAFFQDKGIEELLIGCDMRETSELFKYTLAGRALSGGINVTLVESPSDTNHTKCSTQLFNYICSVNPKTAGIMVTASHNPADYNGLKLNMPCGMVIGYDAGLDTIEALYNKRVSQRIKISKGKLSHTYLLREFIEETCQQAKLKTGDFKGVRIAFDCANSMSAIDAKHFFDFLKADVRYINEWLDGTFPAHNTSPAEPENLRQLASLVKSKEFGPFLCGATGDGDYDRMGIVDENGRVLLPHSISSIIVDDIIEKNDFSGKSIAAVYATTLGRAFAGTITRHKGKAYRTPVGRANVINKGLELIKSGSVVIIGAEGSNHIMFPDRRGNFYENALLATASIISYCLRKGVKLSAAAEKSNLYFYLGERNFRISAQKAEELFKHAEERHSAIIAGELSTDDGILVENNKGEWFSLRKSNTEEKIRLNAESPSQERTNEIAQNLENLIFSFGGARV